jgi:hypothetical protein
MPNKQGFKETESQQVVQHCWEIMALKMITAELGRMVKN